MPTQDYILNDGTKAYGVTTILGILNKPALFRWYYNCGKQGVDPFKKKDAAANVGTIAHYLVECHLKNEKPNLDQYSKDAIGIAEIAFLAFLDWEKKNTFKSIFLEKPFVSNKYGFGGCIDIYGELAGRKALIDIKTSSGVYPEMRVQVSAYKNLLLENGHPVDECHILRIDKESGEFAHHTLNELEIEWEFFKALIPVFKMHKQITKERF